MNPYGIVLAILTNCVTISYGYAQKDTVITYLNQDLKKTSSRKAVAVSVAIRQDSIWDILTYTLSAQKKISHIYARDAQGVKLHGSYIIFQPNGYATQVSGWYNEGKLAGTWLIWDIDGVLKDSIIYENGQTVMRASFSTLSGHGIAKETQGRGREGEPDYSFKYVSITDYKDRSNKTYKYSLEGKLLYEYVKQDDVEEYRHYYENGQICRYVKRKNNIIVDESCYTETGEKQDDCKNILPEIMAEVVPEFPGAHGSVEAYILNNFMLQPGFVRSDFTTFRAKIRFTVNEKGRPYNIKILQCSHEGLYLSLLGLIKKMPAWNMRSYVGPYGPLEYSIEFEIPPVSDDDY